MAVPLHIDEQIARIAQGLLALEINTIVRRSISTEKMPEARHALIDIAQEYEIVLANLGRPFQETAEIRLGSLASFDTIRSFAGDVIGAIERAGREQALQERQARSLYVLYRIQKTSDQIKGIFQGLKERGATDWENNLSRAQVEQLNSPLSLTTDEMLTLRKAWEIGTEEVAMQTVIQLDGDVLTRIQPEFATDAYRILHDVHHQGIETSVGFWKGLVDIVGSIVRTVGGFVTARR